MKTLNKILLVCLLLLGVTTIQAQVSSFRSFKETKGAVTTSSQEMYIWGPWEQSETYFVLDIPKRAIFVEDVMHKEKRKYEIFDKPQKWVVKKNYKYINFECMEMTSMDKFFVRLCEYDTGDFKITVMSPKSAVRYQVIYVKDNSSIDIDFDDVE